MVVMSLLYSIQEFLIFPGRISQGQSYARLITPRHAKMVEIRTACGEKISALLGYAIERDGNVATDFGRRPTLLFFYGNSSCLSYSLVEFENFRRLGVNVMIPDYVGYGLSSGKVVSKVVMLQQKLAMTISQPGERLMQTRLYLQGGHSVLQ